MFKNTSVKWQLGLGFTSVVGLFAVTVLVVGLLLSQLTQDLVKVNDRSLPLILAVDAMNLSRSDVQQFLTDVSATHDDGGYKDAEDAAKRFHENAELFRAHFKATNDSKNLQDLDALESKFNAFYALGKTMAQAYVANGMEAGNALMKGSPGNPGFDAASDALMTHLEAFQKAQVEQARQVAVDALGSARSIQTTMIAGGLLAAALAAACGVFIVRGLMRQLGGEPRVAARLAQRVGEGDLAFQIDLQSGDTTSLLAQLKAMQSNLARVVSTVRQESEGVATASSEISQGNHDLSARTEHQASALEQTASSMEDLNAKVQRNADSALQANQLARSAADVASAGGEVVAEVVQTMRHINDSSSRIFDIISVIDGIAFQTNILALNAAVEAARAGEQGRGFAVVASEVRSLAGRSAEAAREIKTLINTSVERVEQGNLLVDKAGSTMAEVVDSIRRVTDIMGEISGNSSDQRMAVAQISEAVNQMDRVTQQNAALVEEMAAAASGLQSRSDELVHTVSTFKLGGDALARAPRPHPAPAFKPSVAPAQAAARTALPQAPRSASKARVAAPAKARLPAPQPLPVAAAKPKPVARASDNEDWETF